MYEWKCLGCGLELTIDTAYKNYWCSLDCKLKRPKRKSKCKPKCPDSELSTILVTFRDDTVHAKLVCNLCPYSKYISKKLLNDHVRESVFYKRKKELDTKYGDSFYSSIPWLRLRYSALIKYGSICHCCGSTKSPIHVDHIIPRSIDRSKELDFNNLQILCADCNIGKGNSDTTDFRIL